MLGKNLNMPTMGSSLPGRETEVNVTNRHYVNGNPIKAPFPEGFHRAVFGAGCFWGVERLFWQLPGVYSSAVGYAGGITPNPSYEEVCSGNTAHNEVVLVVFDPAKTSFNSLLKTFWESHDPTQGMRQGNDLGTQYRSGIYTTSDSQQVEALRSKQQYEKLLSANFPNQHSAGSEVVITTELKPLECFYYAEEYHQQYLAKNPNGYCSLAGTGVAYR